MTGAAPRVATFDGVRGVAILLVMLLHLTVVDTSTAVGQLLTRLTAGGATGVDLFFVLSGALITGVLLDSKGAPGWLRSFYVRRTLRIWPLYYVFLVVAFYVLPRLGWLTPELGARINRDGQPAWPYFVFLQNFNIAQAGAFRRDATGVTWSLAIEEQFYLVWPWLVLLLSRLRPAWVLGGLLAACCVARMAALAGGMNVTSVYVLTPFRLDGLCIGSLLALAVRGGVDRRQLVWMARAGLGVGGAVVLAILVLRRGFSVQEDRMVMGPGLLGVSIFFGGFVAAAWLANGSGTWFDRLLSGRVLGAFGRYSYGLYLVHSPLRAALYAQLFNPDRFPASLGGVLAGQLLFYVAATALSFAVAAASYHLLETPFLRLKDRFWATPHAAGEVAATS